MRNSVNNLNESNNNVNFRYRHERLMAVEKLGWCSSDPGCKHFILRRTHHFGEDDGSLLSSQEMRYFYVPPTRKRKTPVEAPFPVAPLYEEHDDFSSLVEAQKTMAILRAIDSTTGLHLLITLGMLNCSVTLRRLSTTERLTEHQNRKCQN